MGRIASGLPSTVVASDGGEMGGVGQTIASRFAAPASGRVLAEDRIQLDTAGQVELKLKTPWRDCTTRLCVQPDTASSTLDKRMPTKDLQ